MSKVITGKTLTDIEVLWVQSSEYLQAYKDWFRNMMLGVTFCSFYGSQEYRDARLAFRKRINGRTKADH